MYILGLTGGICAGKSSITRILKDLGAIVIDADLLGHEAYKQQTTCYSKLVEHFGHDNIVNTETGDIDRRKLGGIVFSDAAKMHELQAIVWPEIKQLILSRLEAIRQEEKEEAAVTTTVATIVAREEKQQASTVVVLEAAIMLEAQWQDLVSTLWIPYIDREVAKSRLMQRNGLSEEEALKRIDSQTSNEVKLKSADVTIDNNSLSHAELESEVRRLCFENPQLAHLVR